MQTLTMTGETRLKIFLAGASGSTGRLLMTQLLQRGHQIISVVRSIENMSESFKNNESLSLIQASILDLSDSELSHLVKDCGAVASCLGHNISLKGIYGQPLWLVTDATRRLCMAIKANQPQTPVRFVLMNTVGNQNRNLNEKLEWRDRFVLGLMRLILPPQRDNERAAEYMRTEIGQKDETIEWVAVRPDSLLDEDLVTEYTLHASPTSSSIIGDGKTSRINAAHFMAELITGDDFWKKWKGQMPVIYNKS